MAYPPKLQEFLDTLNLFESRQERIEALIGVAERFQPVPARLASKPYLESDPPERSFGARAGRPAT